MKKGLRGINPASKPSGDGCVECLASPKGSWFHLRRCAECFVVDVPDVFTQAFVMEKNSKRFPTSGGWGYALFNYEAASDKFTADPKSFSDCGHACHTAVKAKNYIFHPYEKR